MSRLLCLIFVLLPWLRPTDVANPPCMFGVNSSFGLAEPPLMNGMTIRVEHVTNATYGHHGEMGL